MSTTSDEQGRAVLPPPAAPGATGATGAVQRRTLGTLVVTQALGGVGLSAAIAMAALLAKDVSGSESLAGLAQTGQVLGAAVSAAFLAGYMSRHGRRPGLSIGYGIGALGAVTCVVAGALRSFPLLLVGAVLLGATTAANNQARYAATDLSAPGRRGRDLSLVVWATTLGAVLGPNLAGPGGRVAAALHLPPMTGPFLLATLGIALAGAVMAFRLRPDPLLTARAVHRAGLAAGATPTPYRSSWRTTWALVAARPLVLAAVAGLALTHAVMVSVMVMTPIHMDHGHSSLELIGLVISVHILGMYAFAPVVGAAVDRFGSTPVLGAGALVLLASLLLAGRSQPGASWPLGAGLFLLGLGWSMGTIASSTLLTAATPEVSRPDVQGAADMTAGFTAAAGGAVAGVVVGYLGYPWLAALGSVLALGVLAVAMVAARHTAQDIDLA